MSAARYFQGTSVLGPVKESAARTFKDIVDLLRVCVRLPINHADFLALAERERNEAKKVPFLVPACFSESPSKRDYAHATHCNLIFLDIDPEKEKRDGKWVETGRFPAAPFVNDPSLIEDALQNFNFAAHLTASSTPQKPRMRIIVDAENIPLSEYPKAVATIGTMLGLPSITRESSVAVQPMFLPTLFFDSSDDFQPLLTHRIEGQSFSNRDIKDSLDSFHGVNGNKPKPDTAPQPHSDDQLEFLRAPVPEVTLGIAKDALSKVDPDLSYHEWIEVAQALRHQFSPQREAEAYEIFDEWSAKGDKYAGDKETKAKWLSVRQSPNGRLPITIRSLLRRAQEGGWKEQQVKEEVFNNLLQWMEEASCLTDLIDQGVKRIIGAPLLSSMQEDVLIKQISAVAKRRFSITVSPTSTRKDLARAKAEAKEQQSAPFKEKVAKWAEDMVYVQAPQEFYRYRTNEKLKVEAFNASYARHLPLSKDKKATLREQAVAEVTPAQYALNKIQIKTVYDYAYDPSQPTMIDFVDDGKRYINTYSPSYKMEEPKWAKRAGELLQGHLRNLILEPINQRHLLDFMAFQVQAPGRKVRWCPLIQSVEGAGKNFLEKVMKAVLGEKHVELINGESVKKGWNDWSFGHQMVVLDEVKVTGTTKHEIMNTIKPLITNDDITINERFRNSRTIKNITNYMIFSNHHDALALTPGDRRYFVIKSPLQTKAQVLALGENYFSTLFDFLRDHPGGMRSFLLNWEISADFDPDGHAPRTIYAEEMVNDSASELTTAVRQLLLQGDHPMIQFDIASATQMRVALQVEEGLDRISSQRIAQVLREEGMTQIGRFTIGDDRHYVWTRQGITEAEAIATIQDRAKRGLKNLHMELLYS